MLVSCWLILAAALAPLGAAEGVSEKVQGKLDRWIAEAKQWAADPIIVKAVAAQNAKLPAAYVAMTQEKWESLTDLDPLVHELMKNAAGQALKTRKTHMITEAFVSDANGLKVAFLGKTSNWSHKGKPKHDVPMTGQVWQGKFEVDKSSGMQQIQLAVPILADGKPIGSLVLGISLKDFTADS